MFLENTLDDFICPLCNPYYFFPLYLLFACQSLTLYQYVIYAIYYVGNIMTFFNFLVVAIVAP
jgi:hypothetical protein